MRILFIVVVIVVAVSLGSAWGMLVDFLWESNLATMTLEVIGALWLGLFVGLRSGRWYLKYHRKGVR